MLVKFLINHIMPFCTWEKIWPNREYAPMLGRIKAAAGRMRVFGADVCGEAMRYWGYEMPWLASAGLSRTAGAR